MKNLIRHWREMLGEQVEYRELLRSVVSRDIRLRYKQTIMGFGWAVFMPLLNTAVFTVIFTQVAPLETPVPYALYAYCGLWVWNFFASSLRFSVISLTSNPNLVTKVYFPREIFPFSSVLVCLVDFAVGGTVLVGLMVYYQVAPTVWLLFLPVVLIIHIAFTAAVSLLLAMGNLFYRDVKYLFELVVSVWMFATSVLYPVELIAGRLSTIAQLNPMTPIIDGYRAAILGVPLPHPNAFMLMAAISLLLLGFAWSWFHKAEFSFAENI